MYHHVAPNSHVPAPGSPEAEGGGWFWHHTPDALERHIQRLQEKRYQIVSLENLVQRLTERTRTISRLVALTFDDGWVDNYTWAVPVLRRCKAPATFFVISEYLRAQERDPRRMSADQLRELHRHGFTIGAHSRHHKRLRGLTDSELREEVAGCKADLETAIGAPVTFFAYPYGDFDGRVVEAVRAAGYSGACCSIGARVNHDGSRYWLHRDVLSEGMNTMHDWYRLTPMAVRALGFRADKRVKQRLEAGTAFTSSRQEKDDV